MLPSEWLPAGADRRHPNTDVPRAELDLLSRESDSEAALSYRERNR